jgi:hypothetical protein
MGVLLDEALGVQTELENVTKITLIGWSFKLSHFRNQGYAVMLLRTVQIKWQTQKLKKESRWHFGRRAPSKSSSLNLSKLP